MKPVGLIVFVLAMLCALAWFVAFTYGAYSDEIDPNFYVDNKCIVVRDREYCDTLWMPGIGPESAWIDSAMRYDSLKLERYRK
jgi:hypothetical protein